MDLVVGMEVGAEIEVTEDGALEELPLRLENAKNCLSWEGLDCSSSDDDGEACLTLCLPVRRPPRPPQFLPALQPVTPPSAAKLPAPTKWIVPSHLCPLRPGLPNSPGIPVPGAYQCQRCLQGFVEEWHYAQHIQEHAQEEEAARRRVARLRSLPRKQRCPECGKRFLHPHRLAQHTKWHLRLARMGIKVCRNKGSRCSPLVSYVYQTPGASGSRVGMILGQAAGQKGSPGLGNQQASAHPTRNSSRSLGKPKNVQNPRAGKRKRIRQRAVAIRASMPKRGPPRVTGVSSMQPGSPKAILHEDAEGRFIKMENQVSILDGEIEVRSSHPGHHYSVEHVVTLATQVSASPAQPGGTKEQAAFLAGQGSPYPQSLFRTVFVKTEEQAAILDGQAEVIVKASDLPPALFLDAESHLPSSDIVTLCLVPLHPEPYGNSYTQQLVEATNEVEEAWDSQSTAFQLTGYLPPLNRQQSKPAPTKPAHLPESSPLLVRMMPFLPGDHPEVLELEYDTGGGIPVASEPWEAGAGEETYGEREEDNYIIVEVEDDACGHEVTITQGSFEGQPLHGSPTRPARLWRFKCRDCGVCYSQASQLRSHRKGLRRRGQSRLCECGGSFWGLLHLLRHQLRHLEETTFVCAACRKSLRGPKALATHGAKHPGAACFRCLCGANFQRLPRYLWHHLRSQPPRLRIYTLTGFLSAA
uniref:C2H2-type domain-containing protein n=1 Tax=Sphenodon punctatus TaxID=8508 RepID=A0A8D0HHQ3_SPHPU